ncbi:hypothetical protein ESA94_19065 [Lacibacter luteus]|uniref:Uncharacterized protein n=1 Tax=Lacibacter luteus TaxID=2508719 RepID=A0A4Q1CE85_9BACT|nr:hypothetical protein [Lacibacter luteus]RXK58113.1 hypothetical protein ESA94_19065 [Lacibacter luteus]
MPQSFKTQATIFFRLSFCLLFTFFLLTAYTQTPAKNKQQQKAEQALLKYLHKLCTDFTKNEMPIELGTITKPFRIEQESLVLVRRFETDSAVLFQKYIMPVSEITDVFFDYYIGFEGTSYQSVSTAIAKGNEQQYNKSNSLLLLHVAPVGDIEEGYTIQTKLLSLVKALQEAYKK